MPAYDPVHESLEAVCFLDDAATDQKTVDHAMLGGVVFNQSGFTAFDEHWTDLMHRYGITQPFHMRELTPHGRLSHISGCRRWCLLADVMGAINFFNLYNVAISLNNREHEQQLGDKLQAAMRVYRLAFMAVVVANVQIAESKNYGKPIAYCWTRAPSIGDRCWRRTPACCSTTSMPDGRSDPSGSRATHS
jgi:hypothetical protein